MQISAAEWRSLSHRERRVLVNKERRRRKRKAAALKREEEKVALESQPGYLERLAAQEKLEEERRQKEEAHRQLEHEAWLEREKVAQEEFRVKREREEKEQREKEERERLIREEWELLQKKEKEAKEKREQLRREKEERLQEALSTEARPAVEKPTHNPLAPEGYTEPGTRNYGTERDMQNCPFFLKTGACRFGDACSRMHPYPSSSTTILIPGMYASLGLTERLMDDQNDAGLEHEEGDMYEQFRSFYDDVFPEFAAAGEIVQFKVSCNYEPHLRGNVYVQYKSEEECNAAYQKFNGRWYAQKQLSCQFCPVQRWRNAICGLYSQRRCPKGKHCNFLHVFRNPGGAFSRADHDLPPYSPSHSSRLGSRRQHSRTRSRSRERSERSQRRRYSSETSCNGRRRRRSSSRERRRSRTRRTSHESRRRNCSNSSTRRGKERRHRERNDSEGDGEKRDTSVKNGVDTDAQSATEASAGEDQHREHKKKKKKKRKRSDGSMSPSSKRRHKHKKWKKRERSASMDSERKLRSDGEVIQLDGRLEAGAPHLEKNCDRVDTPEGQSSLETTTLNPIPPQQPLNSDPQN